jgi:hyperosmotically inducible periplasmic protein
VVIALPIVGMRALKEECMHQYCFQRLALAVAVVGLCVVPTAIASAQTPPDNTKINTRDRSKDAKTADQQKENATDRELTASIRRALMDDKDLSSYAHNVKIISQGGKVTLKGPVRSEDEKRVVETKATEVAGAGHVTNQMSVAKKTP